MSSVLQQQYKDKVIEQLKKSFGYKNVMAVPTIKKVVINAGFSKDKVDKGYVEIYEKVFTRIAGQKPVANKARVSISNFKLREGTINGMTVTLRGKRMWEFLDKLVHITLPRVRDFRGIPVKAVDSSGNLTVGFKEHLAFPEINPDEVDHICGLQVCISTTAKSKQEGYALFDALGFPFNKE